MDALWERISSKSLSSVEEEAIEMLLWYVRAEKLASRTDCAHLVRCADMGLVELRGETYELTAGGKGILSRLEASFPAQTQT